MHSVEESVYEAAMRRQMTGSIQSEKGCYEVAIPFEVKTDSAPGTEKIKQNERRRD
jgi:hypothetical protein